MKWSAAVLATCLGTVCAVPAYAQSQGDRYWLELSLYRPNVDTKVQVSSTASSMLGTEIDLERDLDLKKKKTLPALLLGARLSRHFVLFGEYYSLQRSGVAELSGDITFDDVTYAADATVTSGMDSDIYRFSVGWIFANRPGFEAGASLGLHATDFAVSITGEAASGETTFEAERRRRKFLAPLPTVGLFANWEIARGWTLGSRLDYLSLKIGDYDGRLVNARVSLLYRFSQRVGIGAAWRYVDYRVDITKPDWEGRVDYDFNGPSVFLLMGF